MIEDQGASAKADRAGGPADLSPCGSQPKALIPSADDLEVALWVAMTAHRGQRDKGGEPYIFHPIRVSQRVRDRQCKIVALLHDVLEDSAYTVDFLRGQFGDAVTDAVVALTKKKGQTYTGFIVQCGRNDLARKVKRADLSDNMDIGRLGREPTSDDARRQRKYAEALGMLAAIDRLASAQAIEATPTEPE